MWYITYVAGDGLLTEEQLNTTPSLTQAALLEAQEINDVFIGRWSKVSEDKVSSLVGLEVGTTSPSTPTQIK